MVGSRRLTAAVLGAATALTAGAALGTVPPPTPVPPSGSPSPFPTSLRTPALSTTPPAITAPEAILEDLDTGQILVEKAARGARPIASLTKLMTALVVLERLPLPSTVTVSARAAGEPGATLGLRAGERLSARDLLYALLVQSSDDAAVALAERVSGSVSRFVVLMNDRAVELGLGRTRFASPDGVDDAGHSSPRDVAILTREANRHPTFARIVRTKRYTIPAPSGPSRRIQNRNVLLWLYPGAIGVKTGFTTPAGHCLVAAARRGERALLTVVLGAPDDRAFDDGAALLDFGFHAFERTTLIVGGVRVDQVRVDGRDVAAVASSGVTALVRADQRAAIRRTFRPIAEVHLPITAGQQVGTLTFRAGGRTIGSVVVVAKFSVTSRPASPLPAGPMESLLRILQAISRELFDGFL